MGLVLVVVCQIQAATGPELHWQGHTLRPGDVILLSLNCYVCRLIELENGAPFSHSGILLWDHQEDRWWVGQSLTGVKLISLTDFLAQRKAGTEVLFVRAGELERLAQLSPRVPARIAPFTQLSIELWQSFDKQFKGKAFDPHFLWDNSGANGEELLYCSEFVAKLLNRVLQRPIDPRPMHFDTHREGWERFFHGAVPHGLPGLAPSDFAILDGMSVVARW